MSLEIGQVLKGRYRIQAILGEGGMGTVYLAQDILMDRPRAIKELYSDPLADEAKLLAARTQFEREAETLKKLRHKNLPHVNDYFSIDENDYLVMDYVGGESLADILKQKKRPTEPLLYNWVEQILDAMEYCHRNNVLHRDIKPANIILTPENKVVLVDFGLVKFLDPHNPRTKTIVHGLGTPEYTPLEQYDASMGHTDARSDIYALGATLYHLLTGRPPQPVSQRILKPDTQPDIRTLNVKVSPWMSTFIYKAMAIRPEDRYQSVGEMRQELQRRVFKVRSQTRASASPRPVVSHTAAPHRQAQPEPGTVKQEYRHGRSQSGQRPFRRYASKPAPELLPVLLPMLKPIAIISAVVILGSVFLGLASTSIVAGIVLITPFIIGGLAYSKFISGRHNKPPRF